MKRLIAFTMAAWSILSLPSTADSPVVVELYTSQGCSSCPPADALFHEISDREDVIALSLHVDYWDYIGWKDEFADPAHAKRQRAYARGAGRRSIYTPEMIVNGTTDIVGTRPMQLADAIAKHAQAPAVMDLGLVRNGDELVVSSDPVTAEGPFVVHMMRYAPSREARITRGENAGRTLTYANVVEGWKVLGQWDGRTPLSISADVEGDMPVVVLVQNMERGTIIGANRLR